MEVTIINLKDFLVDLSKEMPKWLVLSYVMPMNFFTVCSEVPEFDSEDVVFVPLY